MTAVVGSTGGMNGSSMTGAPDRQPELEPVVGAEPRVPGEEPREAEPGPVGVVPGRRGPVPGALAPVARRPSRALLVPVPAGPFRARLSRPLVPPPAIFPQTSQ